MSRSVFTLPLVRWWLRDSGRYSAKESSALPSPTDVLEIYLHRCKPTEGAQSRMRLRCASAGHSRGTQLGEIAIAAPWQQVPQAVGR